MIDLTECEATATDLPAIDLPPISIPLIDRAHVHAERAAIIDPHGSFTYGDLLLASALVAKALLTKSAALIKDDPERAGPLNDPRSDRVEARVAFLVTPGFLWAATLWGIWRAGGIAVPLPMQSTKSELEYLLADCGASVLISDLAAAARVGSLASERGVPLLVCDKLRELISNQTDGEAQRKLRQQDALGQEPNGRRSAATIPNGASTANSSPTAAADRNTARRAMILYTSGTTSRPKGVVTTHANITAQITTLVEAWAWSPEDRILLCLPLHHVHGIINVLSCALWSGATCHMLPQFDAVTVWNLIAEKKLSLFMAVPTIYARLIAAWEQSSPERRAALSAACVRFRLMVSGSAALPVSTLERWREISGHTLLERYGMTEIGMALSNPLHGEREPGSVGRPLPGVEIRLTDENGELVPSGTVGEIEVRGPSVFSDYWGKPDATRAAFRNGWFRTGDTAIVENGIYRILGRTSVDIIKTGGHKVSALEIEDVLLRHPAIAECAVVGVPDAEWGQRVAVVVVLKNVSTDREMLDLDSLRAWAKEFLAPYKAPSRLLIVEMLPRNAMGKVTKPAVAELFEKA